MNASSQAWWRTVPDGAFQERLALLTTPALDELVLEIGASLAAMQAQLTSPNGDPSWRHALNYALNKSASRRRLVRAEIASRQTCNRGKNFARKRRLVAEARAYLDRGDVAGAVRVLVDSLDPENGEDR